MLFLILSVLYWVTVGYCLYLAHKNGYVIPKMMFDPTNDRWKHFMLTSVYGITVVLMVLLYLASSLSPVQPVVNWIVWIADIVSAVLATSAFSKAVDRSQHKGLKYENLDTKK